MGKKSDSTQQVIVVCGGTACSDKKSKKLRTRLKEYVKDNSLNIKIKKGDCAKSCKDGPIVNLSPGGPVLTKVKPKDAASLIKKALGR